MKCMVTIICLFSLCFTGLHGMEQSKEPCIDVPRLSQAIYIAMQGVQQQNKNPRIDMSTLNRVLSEAMQSSKPKFICDFNYYQELGFDPYIDPFYYVRSQAIKEGRDPDAAELAIRIEMARKKALARGEDPQAAEKQVREKFEELRAW